MSFYGIEADQIEEWRSRRKVQLSEKFGNAVHKVIGGSPWQHEVEVRLGDAADKQARAERLAYMRGEPVPSETEILSELLAWVRSGDCKRGGADTLPSLTTAEEAKMPKTINEGLVALATLMGQANPSHSDSESIKAGLARLDNTWSPPLQLACKLLDGKSFGLISGNRRTIDRCKALAEHIGAVTCSFYEDEWCTMIAFHLRTGASDGAIHSIISEGIGASRSFEFNKLLAEYRAKEAAAQCAKSDD